MKARQSDTRHLKMADNGLVLAAVPVILVDKNCYAFAILSIYCENTLGKNKSFQPESGRYRPLNGKKADIQSSSSSLAMCLLTAPVLTQIKPLGGIQKFGVSVSARKDLIIRSLIKDSPLIYTIFINQVCLSREDSKALSGG